MTAERIFIWVIGTMLFCTIFLVTDCSMGKVEQVRVEVVAKEYEPERRWTTINPVRVGEVTTMQTQRHYDDPDWLVKLQGYDRDGDLVTRTIDLDDPTRFENTKMGDIMYIDMYRGKFTGWKY